MIEDRNCGCSQMDISQNIMEMNNMTTMECCNNQRKEDLLCKIQELDFAIEDLALYLDTNPDDQKALCLHKEYCKQMKSMRDMYQRVYGPLTINCPCNKWRWIEEPWPWERGNC